MHVCLPKVAPGDSILGGGETIDLATARPPLLLVSALCCVTDCRGVSPGWNVRG
jgi:hypothetical protein